MRWRTLFKRNGALLLMMAPGLGVLFIFAYLPMFGISIIFNTLFMNALFIVSVLVVALGIALLLKEVQGSNRWLTRFYQSTLFFPYLFSYVIINYFVFALLNTSNGLVNHTLMGLGGHAVNWHESPQRRPVILTLVTVWKNAGFWSIVYLAGMI